MVNSRKKPYMNFIIIILILVSFCGCSKKMNGDGTPASKIEIKDNLHDAKTTEIIDEKTSEVSETDERQTPIEMEHPDDYYIHWVIPVQSAAINDEYIAKVNEKLEADGYDFGIKVIRIIETFDTDAYEEGIYEYADIAFTGMQLNGKNLAEKMVSEGKLYDITDLAENSPYFMQMNPLLRESVTVNGKIYYFPNELAMDGSRQYVLSSIDDNSMTESVKADINELKRYVSDINKLFYGWTGFDFARCFGYDYDTARGIVATTDGDIINPLENEKCLEWMERVNDWYKKDMIRNINKDTIRNTCSIILTSNEKSDNDQFAEKYSWQIKLCKRILSSTVILADSDKKEKAFRFLELLRMNHDYGNLLVYGHTVSQNPDEEPLASSLKWVYGIDDGLFKSEYGSNHFKTSDERNDFYNNNVEASVTLYMDLPFECSDLKRIVEKYLGYENSILFRDDYEEKMEMFKKEYTEKLNEIKKIMEEKNEA